MGKKYFVESLLNGKVLDVKDGCKTSGSEVTLWSKNGGDNQLWKYKDGMLKSVANKELVLDIDVSNKRIIVYTAHGGANQQWRFNSDATLESQIESVLDVEKSRNVEGAMLIPYGRHGGKNQQFKLVEKTW